MRAQRERIEELEEEVRQLRDLLFAEDHFQFLVRCREVLGTTPTETRVLAALSHRRVMTREALMMALYSDRADDPPDVKIMAVMVCKLRRRLKPLGVEINTIWGRGYQITSEHASRLIATLGLDTGKTCAQVAWKD